MLEHLKINYLNQRGEGVAEYLEQKISVPFTLPDEVIEGEILASKNTKWAKVETIIQPSINRVSAPCPHYQTCGGCSLQHFDDATYRQFKKQQVTSALKSHDLDDSIVNDPLIIGPEKRRRIDFKVKKFPERLSMGFNEINSRRRITLQTCLIVDPRISPLFEPLHEALDSILQMREEAHVFILAADNGIDLLLAGFKRQLTDEQKQSLIQFAKGQDLVRLTYKVKRKAEILYEKSTPFVTFADHNVEVNPNVFLQASSEADNVLAQLVSDAIPTGTKKAADLFCGRGTLSIPLTYKVETVDGYEGDKHAIAALESLNIENLKSYVRDLFAQPLLPDELVQYDVVVMNPPRSGVKDQIHHLIEAQIPIIIYVSCNPESFASDMKILLSNGYELKTITPVDQFMWSHHIEVVGVAHRTL